MAVRDGVTRGESKGGGGRFRGLAGKVEGGAGRARRASDGAETARGDGGAKLAANSALRWSGQAGTRRWGGGTASPSRASGARGRGGGGCGGLVAWRGRRRPRELELRALRRQWRLRRPVFWARERGGNGGRGSERNCVPVRVQAEARGGRSAGAATARTPAATRSAPAATPWPPRRWVPPVSHSDKNHSCLCFLPFSFSPF